ncbi:MAG: hypothetical protein Q8O04_07595 [Deltaproteobacteria bacterium]|nr:hypothetical protein [Deltaproteobacteria bacterium]
MTDESSKPNPTDLVNRPGSSGSLLETAFQSLPKEQRQKLMEKALEKKLELDVEAARAEGRHIRSDTDMHNTVRHVRELESSTKSDYTVKATFETASGNTSVEVKKSNNTTIIIVAVVIAVVFLVLFSR